MKTLLLFLVNIAILRAQTTVYIQAVSSGQSFYDGSSYTKTSSAVIRSGNSDDYRGWAKFDLNGAVPPGAAITSAAIRFNVESRTFNSQPSNRLRVITQDPLTRSTTNLFSDLSGSSSANRHETNSDTYLIGLNTIDFNTTGVNIIISRLTSFIAVGFYRHTFNGTYVISGSNHTNVGLRPTLILTYGTPLPVQLISFEGSCVDGLAEIKWSTATEINNKEFNLMGSIDSENWELIARIKGMGNTNVKQDYSHSFENTSNMKYFKLKQIDYNGEFEIFKPISLNCESDAELLVSFFPNPVKDILNIKVSEEINNGLLRIFSMNGQCIYLSSVSLKYLYSLDLQMLRSGIYFLTLTSEGKTIGGCKIVKE